MRLKVGRRQWQLPPVEYAADDLVLTVDWNGWIKLHNRPIKVPIALHRHRIVVRPHGQEDGVFDLFFCHHRFMQVDLHAVNDQD